MVISNYTVNKKDIIFILLILTLALTLRFFYFKDYMNSEAYPVLEDSDAYSYSIWAKDIASGDVLGNKAFMKWPLYAYVLALLFKLSNNSVFSVYALQFILGSLNCILIYLIARLMFNAIVGFLAALLCLCYGLFVFYEGLLIYTSLSLFLNSLFFLFILFLQNNFNKKKLFLLGLFLGICALAQANIVIFGILAVLWIIWRKRLSISNLIYHFLCFMLGLALVIGAVTLRNYFIEKDLVLISGNMGVNFYIGNNPQADGTFNCPQFFDPYQDGMFKNAKIIAKLSAGKELKTSAVSQFWFNKSLGFMFSRPVEYSKLLLRKIMHLFSPEEFIHDQEYQFVLGKIRVFKFLLLDLRLILPLAFAGIFLSLRRFKETIFLQIILITLSFSIILFFVATRYRIIMVPFLAIFAAFGLFNIYDLLSNKKYLGLVRLGILLISLFLLFNYKIFVKKKNITLNDRRLIFNYHLNKAVIYERKSDYQNSMRQLEIADRIQPGSRQAALSFGVEYYSMNNLKMAEEKFKEALRIFPLYVDAYYNLGFLYNQQQRFDEAGVMLSRAAFLDPDDVAVHYELGRAYKAKGEMQKAKEEFTIALEKINRWRTQEKALLKKELTELGK